jgi:hypothetical protein
VGRRKMAIPINTQTIHAIWLHPKAKQGAKLTTQHNHTTNRNPKDNDTTTTPNTMDDPDLATNDQRTYKNQHKAIPNKWHKGSSLLITMVTMSMQQKMGANKPNGSPSKVYGTPHSTAPLHSSNH